MRTRLTRTLSPRERKSDLIYISTEHAPAEEKLLGPTTRYVLAKRPCRVIVSANPSESTEGQATMRRLEPAAT